MIETDGSDADMFKASRFATGSREPNGIWTRFQHLAIEAFTWKHCRSRAYIARLYWARFWVSIFLVARKRFANLGPSAGPEVLAANSARQNINQMNSFRIQRRRPHVQAKRCNLSPA